MASVLQQQAFFTFGRFPAGIFNPANVLNTLTEVLEEKQVLRYRYRGGQGYPSAISCVRSVFDPEAPFDPSSRPRAVRFQNG